MVPDKRLMKNIDKYCSPLLSHKKTKSRTSRTNNRNNENVSETSTGKWEWVNKKMKQFGRERNYEVVSDENSSQTERRIYYEDILVVDYAPKNASPSSVNYKLTPSDAWYDTINWMIESCEDEDVDTIDYNFGWRKNGDISPKLKKFFVDGYQGESEHSKEQKRKAAAQKKNKKKKKPRKKKKKVDKADKAEHDVFTDDDEDDENDDDDDDVDDEEEEKNKNKPKRKQKKKKRKWYTLGNGLRIEVCNLFLICF